MESENTYPIPNPGPQYCVHMAAAIVSVTMLIQLASLVSPISKDSDRRAKPEPPTSTSSPLQIQAPRPRIRRESP